MSSRLSALIVLFASLSPGAREKAQIYRLIDNPWPVQDRDYVIEAELFRTPETGEAVIQNPGGGPPAAFINMALSKIGNDLFDGLYRFAEGTP